MVKSRRFCGYCGAPFLVDRSAPNGPFSEPGWPRKCSSPTCGELTFANPAPVAVLLVKVGKEGPLVAQEGLLIVQRGIDPGKGEYAFPGGYVELGETWQEACCREVYEETTVDVDPSDVELFDARSVAEGQRIILFGITKKLHDVDVAAINRDLLAYPIKETQAVRVLTAAVQNPARLAFPTHTEMVKKFFKPFRPWDPAAHDPLGA